MKLWLEMEIGITGGEEDGVDNTGVKAEALCTRPEQVWHVHEALSAIGPYFSIAAAFGNVHGVYKAGNVVLSHMLDLSEEFDEENIATCVKYFKRMAPMKLWLEMEIGITGGEEDGVDNSGVKAE